jgi:Putative DNA-binding domain
MSLWQKPMSEVTFRDIDAFCSAKHREGTRCDYKLLFPTKLEKTIAAFANTLGGLILLGIDSDPTTNTPIWPAVTGLPSRAGLEEQVYQKATEAIYPPVRVAVSPVIENPNLPGTVVIVIRVDESKDAPHAVDNGRQVLVYERSDNKTDPIQLAKIDRIEHLLNRRQAIESHREENRSKAMERAERLLDKDMRPFMWVSVAPRFPWRQMCRWSACYDFLAKEFHADRVRRIPTGAVFVCRDSRASPGRGLIALGSALGHFSGMGGASDFPVNLRSSSV